MEEFTPEEEQSLNEMLQTACQWVENQERFICESTSRVSLTGAQQGDARQIGVKFPERVRLLYVERIPVPDGFPRPERGLTARYGIFLGTSFRGQRRLITHELVHTMQYERYGSIESFLRAYLSELPDYPNGPLEQEARRIEKAMCGNIELEP